MFETKLTKTSNYNNKTKQVIVSTVCTQPPFFIVIPLDYMCEASTFQLAALRLVKKKEVS